MLTGPFLRVVRRVRSAILGAMALMRTGSDISVRTKTTPVSTGEGRKMTFASLPPNRPLPLSAVGLAIVFCSFKFIHPCGQLSELLNELWQPQCAGDYAKRLFYFNCRRPEHPFAGLDAGYNGALASDHNSVAQFDIVGEADLTSEDNAIADFRAASYADLPRYQTTFADYHVVGNMNEVINFCACTYSGFAEFGPVDAAIGAYFDEILDNNDAVVGY
jgi:hypothetical protein